MASPTNGASLNGASETIKVVAVASQRAMTLPRPETIDAANYMIKAFFPDIDVDSGVTFSAKLRSPTSGTETGEFVKVDAVLWEYLYPHMTTLEVQAPLKNRNREGINAEASAPANDSLKLNVKTLTGRTFTVLIAAEGTVDDIACKIQDVIGLPPDQQWLIYKGRQLEFYRRVRDYSIEDGDTITVTVLLRGKKPVIYLYPPSCTDVSVTLSLVPEWTFDAVYPPAKVVSSADATDGAGDCASGESIRWNVHARPDGNLVIKETGTEVSYLFWEALVVKDRELRSMPVSSDVFVPGHSDCWPEDSVMLAVEDVPIYLDKALRALGLHTEARTSFITYWLPDIQKYKYIALRFIPQAAYEAAAPLSITPSPDVVTRVFMVFQAVRPEHVRLWAGALPSDKPDMWRSTVGIDEARQNDRSLFRVLEWGGMDVTKS